MKAGSAWPSPGRASAASLSRPLLRLRPCRRLADQAKLESQLLEEITAPAQVVCVVEFAQIRGLCSGVSVVSGCGASRGRQTKMHLQSRSFSGREEHLVLRDIHHRGGS